VLGELAELLEGTILALKCEELTVQRLEIRESLLPALCSVNYAAELVLRDEVAGEVEEVVIDVDPHPAITIVVQVDTGFTVVHRLLESFVELLYQIGEFLFLVIEDELNTGGLHIATRRPT
jgi:hypothetical protein